MERERKNHLRKGRNKQSKKLDYVLLGVVLLTAVAVRFWMRQTWWGLLFGLANAAVLALVFFIAKRWSNRKTGLLTTAFFAVSQLTMVQGQVPEITSSWPLYVVDCVRYSMYDSYLFMFATGFLIILPFILGRWNKKMRIISWISMACFLIVPLYSFPFLVIALFSFYRPSTMTKAQTAIAVIGLLFIGTCALIL